MLLSKMIQTGGYAMLLKEVTDRVVTMKNRRQIARRKENTRNLLIGATIGTAAGAAIGILVAPQSGRKTREQIAQKTGEAVDHIKTRVSSAGEVLADRVQQRAEGLREAAAACADDVAEAVKASNDKDGGKQTKKKS
jgi:gas vesicle protein